MNKNKRQRTSAMYSALIERTFDRAWDDPESVIYCVYIDGVWFESDKVNKDVVEFKDGTNVHYVRISDCVEIKEFKRKYLDEWFNLECARKRMRGR